MKRCPECRRDYYDDSLLYCLDDGSALLEGPASMDEPATAILHQTAAPGEAATRAQIHMTEQTAVLPTGTLAIRRHKIRTAAIVAVGAIVLAGFGYGLYRFIESRKAIQPKAVSSMKVTRLTSHGQVGLPAISPDGKYVIYTLWAEGKGSLWLRQVSSNSAVLLVQPDREDVGWGGRSFSPNGEMIYYVSSDKDNERGVLYEIPTLGGVPRKVITNIGSGITFAPDGKTFAFTRDVENEGAEILMSARLDGTGEKVLATRKGNDWFAGDPAWSPDGKTIACGVGTDTGGTSFSVAAVPAEGGAEQPITQHKWFGDVGQLGWLGDGSGLMLSATADLGGVSQIWHLPYPTGEPRQITNDLNGYRYVSVTADSSTLVTRQEDPTQRIWTYTVGEDPARSKQITTGKVDGDRGLAWVPDGRIVYTANTGNNLDIWSIGGDGTGNKQLSSDAGAESLPCTTPDGQYIFFESTRDGGLSHIFRMNSDGSQVTQITSGAAGDGTPVCAPDSKWIAFSSYRTGDFALWKVPVEGGEPIQLTEKLVFQCSFNPDGKTLICLFIDSQFNPPKRRGAIVSFDNGDFLQTFDLPPGKRSYGGSPDGKSQIYTANANGVDNVWSQPIDGGPPKQLTNFKPDLDSNVIYRLAWSHDGRRLAMVRGKISTDIVMIKDFR